MGALPLPVGILDDLIAVSCAYCASYDTQEAAMRSSKIATRSGRAAIPSASTMGAKRLLILFTSSRVESRHKWTMVRSLMFLCIKQDTLLNKQSNGRYETL